MRTVYKYSACLLVLFVGCYTVYNLSQTRGLPRSHDIKPVASEVPSGDEGQEIGVSEEAVISQPGLKESEANGESRSKSDLSQTRGLPRSHDIKLVASEVPSGDEGQEIGVSEEAVTSQPGLKESEANGESRSKSDPDGDDIIIPVGRFKLVIGSSGDYRITANGLTWLRNASTFVTADQKRYSTIDDSLKLIRISQEAGTDGLGDWDLVSLDYGSQNMSTLLEVQFKVYEDISAILFGQHFVVRSRGSSIGGFGSLSSGFPSFTVQNSASSRDLDPYAQLGFLAFGGFFSGDHRRKSGKWSPSAHRFAVSGIDAGPLLLFDENDNAMLITAFDNFMTSSVVHSTRTTPAVSTWGLLGSIEMVPKDHVMWTVAYFSHEGINKAFEGWGNLMRKRYNRNSLSRDSDLTNNFIGYYTDKGSYYYYLTEHNMDYGQTLDEVVNHGKTLHIPYQFLQYDSWFYHMAPDKGILSWDAQKKVFPAGLEGVWNKIGLPVVAHSRYWSPTNKYAKRNGGQFDFLLDIKWGVAIPNDPRFWDKLFMEGRAWGLTVYEQDWLDYSLHRFPRGLTRLGRVRKWLLEMGAAAQRANITIQYCKGSARFTLQALEVPAVSQIRVTTDYKPGNDNWKLGVVSMLADAVGVAPFKDVFWTTKDQPGNVYGGSEPYPALHSLVATLSTGPVTPGDKIGRENATLIMRTCNSAGRILKPSKPAKAVNKQLIENVFGNFNGEVWSTYSQIGRRQFGIVFAANMEAKDKMTLTPHEAGLHFNENTHPIIAFSWFRPNETRNEFSNIKPLTLEGCGNDSFCLYLTTPAIKTRFGIVYLLGELDKWVPMSPHRVHNIESTTNDLQVTLTGSIGEKVVFSYVLDNVMISVRCVVSQDHNAVISIKQSDCK